MRRRSRRCPTGKATAPRRTALLPAPTSRPEYGQAEAHRLAAWHPGGKRLAERRRSEEEERGGPDDGQVVHPKGAAEETRHQAAEESRHAEGDEIPSMAPSITWRMLLGIWTCTCTLNTRSGAGTVSGMASSASVATAVSPR